MTECPDSGGNGRAENIFVAVVWVALASVLVFAAAASTNWRLQHDAPIMFYQAFLMDQLGLVPYRDFFDMNMPGTYLAYLGIGKAFGYSDFPLRIADLLLLAAISFATWSFVRRVSTRAAYAAPVLFALWYLRLGPDVALQRECLVVLAVALSVLAASCSLTLSWRSTLSGFAIGLASTVKPQSAIALLPLVVWFVADVRASGEPRRPLAIGMICGLMGFGTPIGIALAWMLCVGVLDHFIHSVGYLEYYGALSGQHLAIEGWSRFVYTAKELFKLGGYRWWLVFGAAGLYAGLRHGTLDAGQRRKVGLQLGMLAVFALYPAISGQFWPYHWLPFVYWLCVISSLMLATLRAGTPALVRCGSRLALLLLALHVTDVVGGFDAHRRHGKVPPKEGRPDQIAAFLREHLREGDTVQPLDWAAIGVVHGMLIAKAPPATSFLYSFHFYHHVSTPYIRDLRVRFIEQFDEANAAFVIEGRPTLAAEGQRGRTLPWVGGKDTTRRFPGLETRLLERYIPVLRSHKFTIWERRDRVESSGALRKPSVQSR
jgi:hypothetical protein